MEQYKKKYTPENAITHASTWFILVSSDNINDAKINTIIGHKQTIKSTCTAGAYLKDNI